MLSACLEISFVDNNDWIFDEIAIEEELFDNAEFSNDIENLIDDIYEIMDDDTEARAVNELYTDDPIELLKRLDSIDEY